MATAIERETQAIKTEAKKILLIVLFIAILVYAFTGTAQIGQEETGLLIRFGKVVRPVESGLYWGYPWPIDEVVRIPTGATHTLNVNNFNLPPDVASAQTATLRQNKLYKALSVTAQSALANPHLMTGDLNIVHVELSVNYTIDNPEKYYLAAGEFEDISQTNVQKIARGIIANAIIRTLAKMEVMNVLGPGQSAIQQGVAELTQEQFDELDLGIRITKTDPVQIATRGVPADLQIFFDRVTFAQSEKQTQKHLAAMERDQIDNEAKAKSAAIISEARSYVQATISKARGDADRLAKLINEFHQKGEVVRDRLRYEKLAEVAPYFKAPTVHTIKDPQGKQKLVITIPGKPE